MTEAFELPREVETAYRAIPEKGGVVLASLADGNGMRADEVRLVSGETVIYLIPATVTITLAPEMAKSQLNGQNPQGDVLGSEGEVMSASAALLPEFLKGEAVRQDILETLRQQPGDGFGMKPKTIALKSVRRVFSVITTCPQCRGETVVPCPPCQGRGRIPCQTCRGMGVTKCVTCFGTGLMQDPSGERVPCMRCQRRGNIVCHTCNGLKEMACQSCSGQGRTGCSVCAQSGAQTNVYQMSAKASFTFEIDWRKVPQEAKDTAEKLGGEQIVAKKHAEIYWQLPEARDKNLVIEGIACFPIASAVYSVGGKSFPAKVAGLQGRIVEMDPVLDPHVKPGISALSKLSKGPLAADALMGTACKFKLVRRVLGEVSKRPKKAVYQDIVRDYGVILSDKYARAAVSSAVQALQAISKGPRIKGLVFGAVLAGALAAVYYMTPLRVSLYTTLAQKGFERYIDIVDAGDWLIGALAAVFVIRLTVARALGKMLPASVHAEDKGGLPSAGAQGFMAFPAAAVVCVAVAALAAHKPEWILAVLKR